MFLMPYNINLSYTGVGLCKKQVDTTWWVASKWSMNETVSIIVTGRDRQYLKRVSCKKRWHNLV